MAFKNNRQRKAVMAKLNQVQYRVKVPVFTDVDVIIGADKDADFDKIMKKAVKKAEIQEPQVYWEYDKDSADESGMAIVNVVKTVND